MTNATAITTAMSMNIGTSDAEIEKAATDYGLVVSDDYTVDNLNAVNAAAAKLLCGYLLMNSRAEGGFSIAFNIDGIKGQIAYLAKNSGGLFIIPDELKVTQRTVRARFLW